MRRVFHAWVPILLALSLAGTLAGSTGVVSEQRGTDLVLEQVPGMPGGTAQVPVKYAARMA